MPDLVALPLKLDAVVRGEPNPVVSVSWGITNQGTGDALECKGGLYLSVKPVLDEEAVLCGAVSGSVGLEPGESYEATAEVSLPVATNGVYYLFFLANPLEVVTEQELSNNLATASFSFDAVARDLAPLALHAPAVISSGPNPRFTIMWGVTNQGGTIRSDGWVDQVYFSSDNVVDDSDSTVASSYLSGPLPAGGVYWRTNEVWVPANVSGDYYLILQINAENWLLESDDRNNTLAVPLKLQIQPPDLQAAALEVEHEETVLPNPVVTLRWTVANRGPGPATTPAGIWWDEVYLSADPLLDRWDPLVTSSYETGPVAPGTDYSRSYVGPIPVTGSGTYYFILKANAGESLFEVSPTNNVLVVASAFTVAHPDLAPLALLAPAEITASQNPTITVTWGATNQGVGTARGNWRDCLYLSRRRELDDSALICGSAWLSGPVNPGGRYWQTNLMQLPVTESGDYYLILRVADSSSPTLAESDPGNNELAFPLHVEIAPPDLVPTIGTVPTALTGTPNPAVTLVWGGTNAAVGVGPVAQGPWLDQVYLSRYDSLGHGELVVTEEWVRGTVAPGGVYWHTNEVRLPIVESGPYFLLFVTDSYGSVPETEETNNVVAVPVVANIAAPDLAPLVSGLPGEMTVSPRPWVTVVWGTTNQGPGLAGDGAPWEDTIYYSHDATLDWWDSPLAAVSEQVALAPGTAAWRTNALQLPTEESGTNYLIFQVNSSQAPFELNWDDNTVAIPVVLQIRPPDLAPVALQVPDALTVSPNPEVTVVWSVTNLGAGTAVGADAWMDQIYLSRNGRLGVSDRVMVYQSEAGPVAPGESYWRTNRVSLPVVESGTYHLFLKVNAQSNLCETTYTNNLRSRSLVFTVQLPDLAPVAVQVPTVVTGLPHPTVRVNVGITNQGSGPAPEGWHWVDRLYYSTDAVLDDGDRLLREWGTDGPLAAGERRLRDERVTVPRLERQTGYLLLVTDATGTARESNESNNVVALPIALQVTPSDLVPVALHGPSVINGPAYPEVELVWAVTNQGIGSAVGPWEDRLFLSDRPVWESTNQAFLSRVEAGPLAAGRSYWRKQTVRLPVRASGTYYLTLQANGDGNLPEPTTNNNRISVPLQVNVMAPDLAPVAIQVPASLAAPPNPSVALVWGVTNAGAGEAYGNPYWRDALYLSTNTVLDDSAVMLTAGWEYEPIGPGIVYWRTNQVQLPIAQSGRYYLLLQADADGTLLETTRTNNVLAVPLAFEPRWPDLQPLALWAPGEVPAAEGAAVTMTWGVTNQGEGTMAPWVDGLYLADAPSRAAAGWVRGLGFFAQNASLPGHGSYWQSRTVTLPVVPSGQYYFIFETNPDGGSGETNLANNALAVPLACTGLPPDLVPGSLVLPTQVSGLKFPSVTVSWTVTNLGVGRAVGSWHDMLCLSTNPVWGGWASYVESRSERGPLAPGSSYARTQAVTLPVTEPGTYYLWLAANAQGELPEAALSNNLVRAAFTFSRLVPDLEPVALEVLAFASNGPLTVTWNVTNRSVVATPEGWHWKEELYLAPTPTLDADAVLLGSFTETNRLSGSASYRRTNSVQFPSACRGAYHYLVLSLAPVDPWSSGMSPRSLATAFEAEFKAPDLAVTLLAPEVVEGPPYPEVTVVVGVTNRGEGAALGAAWGWWDNLYLSATGLWDGSARQIASWQRTNTLAPGETAWWTNRVRVPVSDGGSYYLMLETDPLNSLGDADLSNNTSSRLVTFNLTLAPDLVALDLIGPSTVSGRAYPEVTLAWGVQNDGLGPATGAWRDSLERMTGGAYGSETVAQFWETNTLAPGASYWRTNRVTLPLTNSGTYQFMLVADTANDLFELDEWEGRVMLTIDFNLVLPPPKIAAAGWDDQGAFRLEAWGERGVPYRLEASSDLAVWEEIVEFEGTGETTVLKDSLAPAYAQRFYRIVGR